MKTTLVTSDEYMNMRVMGGKKGTRRIGKVKNLVFHPSEKRCIGILIKRPDLLLMFHRKDLFVSLSGFELTDGRIRLNGNADTSNGAACKALGVDWNKCVLWWGMPVITADGMSFGYVDNVVFDEETGVVDSIETGEGAAANALLGKYTVPASLIKGFRQGIGSNLVVTDANGNVVEESVSGAILLSDEAKELSSEGGLAEKGGAATAVAIDKVQSTVEKAKPTVDKAVQATGDAVNKGAYATGRQIARSKNMFSDFKDEYQKARGTADASSGVKDSKTAKTTASSKSVALKNGVSQSSGKATTKKAPAKGMFASFKEEYDKARHE